MSLKASIKSKHLIRHMTIAPTLQHPPASLPKTQTVRCPISYVLESLNSLRVDEIGKFFTGLPADPYLEGNYRFRRFSRFKIVENRPIQLPHSYFFQSKTYNPLLGDVIREYEELEPALIALEDFQASLMAFFDFCKLCPTVNEIGVHQIRTTTSFEKIGNPVPEGIHQDGVDWVGILPISRQNISGAETYLYKAQQDEAPIFAKVLNPGDFLLFNDRQFFHFTSSIQPNSVEGGNRDVLVFTSPGLSSPADDGLRVSNSQRR